MDQPITWFPPEPYVSSNNTPIPTAAGVPFRVRNVNTTHDIRARILQEISGGDVFYARFPSGKPPEPRRIISLFEDVMIQKISANYT